MNILKSKFKEVLASVLPITIIVILLNFTLTPLPHHMLIKFLIGSSLIIAGLTIFLAGVDIGVTPIGVHMGSSIAKSNRILIVAISGLVLGFTISIAEPDLHILADQVKFVTSGVISKESIVIVVSIGIAVMIAIGLLRIVFNKGLNVLLAVIYGIILILALFTSKEFLAISFDASGATTGALTVPFMLALAAGVSKLKKNHDSSEEDSFGLVAIASSGAIIAVMAMNIIKGTSEITATLELEEEGGKSILLPFLNEFPHVILEIFIALMPVLVIFIVLNFVHLKLSRSSVRKILFGILYTFIGLVIFLVGVNAGFMDVGRFVGEKTAAYDNKAYVIILAFILGFTTILAEPAVSVLTHQIEDVTRGYIKRRAVLFTLAIGVGFAVALSIIRILVPSLQLWHYLLPFYIIAIVMSFIVPKLFVGIAFDSGGVASGPMTATFILAFAQGAAEATESANVLVDGFGMIAMVAMTPLISLQILGLIFKVKSKKEGIK